MDQIHYWSQSSVTISSSAWKQELMIMSGWMGLRDYQSSALLYVHDQICD